MPLVASAPKAPAAARSDEPTWWRSQSSHSLSQHQRQDVGRLDKQLDLPFTTWSVTKAGRLLGEHARIGNFVELKKTTVGRGSKASHLAYLGDATLGEYVNVGAGPVLFR